MVFKLNFVVASLCIAIGLSTAATYASEDKSRSFHPIPLQPVDVISTGSITIHPADSAHILPGETTSCTVKRSAEHHPVYCRGKKQKTQITLTEPTAAQHLEVEAGATTWVRTPSTTCHISSNNEVPDILCTPTPTPSSPSPWHILYPEFSEPDDVRQSALCASAEESALDTDDTLTEVSQIRPDSDQLATDRYKRPHTGDIFIPPTVILKKMHKRANTGDRPYVCDFAGCNKSFTRSACLTRHERTHTLTRERPYVCDLDGCKKSFIQHSSLTYHKRTQHNKKDE
ncbi:C2H2-type zinc finger protein [Sansalvadorimonas verongulae]|nr:C2H2-type zinc finger protein [Sansalvadorimonas verongulae]